MSCNGEPYECEIPVTSRRVVTAPGDLEPARGQLTRPEHGRLVPPSPTGPTADGDPQPRRRTRRGRRAPSARKRGSKGAKHRERHQRPADSVSLVIGTLNVQSVKPKLLELSTLLHGHNYDLMCLTETWLRPTTPNRLVVLPGYQLLRADRSDGRGYGGVALATRDGVSVSPIKMPADASCPGSKLETLWTLIKPDSRRQFVLCTVYRPPRHTVADLTADFTDLQAQLQHLRWLSAENLVTYHSLCLLHKVRCHA
ncbi:hypothetical protein FJT64_018689 [Amphibalanus amphitrite]|uniref:Endonuclease/exonuclease/phosphatase domain-containing protein n=1 Tax=Amphibalanus amphitrite TaxID=1232801 RepID=A0A6A4WTY0_AMPAM|nr:hypothetical protein FJT64_018689 [Amphibalanus amphitrite]